VGQVYDLIRGANPSPGAWMTVNGVEVDVFDSARAGGDGISSKVMEISEDGMLVQCIGGRVLVKRVRPNGEAKQSAAEWAAKAGIAVGDILGS